MCKAKDKEDPPDYNARLGYGTDQGRWLVDQVGGKEADVVRRVSRVPSRVFHDSNDMAPAPPMHRPASTEPSGVQQLWSSAQQQLQGLLKVAKDNPEDTAIFASLGCVLVFVLGLSVWVLSR